MWDTRYWENKEEPANETEKKCPAWEKLNHEIFAF